MTAVGRRYAETAQPFNPGRHLEARREIGRMAMFGETCDRPCADAAKGEAT